MDVFLHSSTIPVFSSLKLDYVCLVLFLLGFCTSRILTPFTLHLVLSSNLQTVLLSYSFETEGEVTDVTGILYGDKTKESLDHDLYGKLGR